MSQRRSTDIHLEDLILRQARIDARMQSFSARQRLERKKDEDRLKWLLGTLILDRLSHETALREWVRRELPGRLTDRDRARGLWDLLFPKDRDGTE